MATTAKEVIMRPPPKQAAPPKTVQVGDLDFVVPSIEGRPYPKVHQRVEAAHDKGGYSVVEHGVKEIAGIWCYCVVIELPSGQRFPGDAEIDKTLKTPVARAQTRAIGRALAFAGFHIKSSIASEEEMEDMIDGRGEAIVDANGRQEKPMQALIRAANAEGLKGGELVENFTHWAGKPWKELNQAFDESDFQAISAGMLEWIEKHRS